jgi:hypothetical protein
MFFFVHFDFFLYLLCCSKDIVARKLAHRPPLPPVLISVHVGLSLNICIANICGEGGGERERESERARGYSSIVHSPACGVELHA